MIKEFDEIEWIEQFLNSGGNLQSQGLSRVTNFVFLWNIFEATALDRDATLGKIRLLVDNLHQFQPLTVIELQGYLTYFSDRYFNPNGKNTYSLEGLKFRDNQSDQAAKAEVEAVLTRNEIRPEMILKALLIILYRFRNNLFHGNKEIVQIEGQIQNFIVANNILKIVLEKMKVAGMIN